jgi:hypothetical protein
MDLVNIICSSYILTSLDAEKLLIDIKENVHEIETIRIKLLTDIEASILNMLLHSNADETHRAFLIGKKSMFVAIKREYQSMAKRWDRKGHWENSAVAWSLVRFENEQLKAYEMFLLENCFI